MDSVVCVYGQSRAQQSVAHAPQAKSMTTTEQLKSDVEHELSWDPSIGADRIAVSVNHGVVELGGRVGSFYEKWAAERAAFRVSTVKGVASEIKVDLPFAAVRTDEAIAQTVIERLQWSYLPPEAVKVLVADGWVTLHGIVAAQYQRNEAERVVRPLMGVKGVTNEISLEPRVMDVDVKVKIEDALKRSAEIDASHIAVEIAGNLVTLRGVVRSGGEREAAECAAFYAPGVMKVDNLITIE